MIERRNSENSLPFLIHNRILPLANLSNEAQKSSLKLFLASQRCKYCVRVNCGGYDGRDAIANKAICKAAGFGRVKRTVKRGKSSRCAARKLHEMDLYHFCGLKPSAHAHSMKMPVTDLSIR